MRMYPVASADYMLWVPDIALRTTQYREALGSPQSSLLMQMTSFLHPMRFLRRILLLRQTEEPLSDKNECRAFDRSADI
jgi:hypothetical protein